MKINCSYNDFKNNVSRLAKIAGKNISLPILESVLLTAEANNLIIRATNLQIGAEIVLPVKVLEEGQVAVKGDILLSSLVFNSSNDFELKIIKEDNILILSGEGTEIKLKTFDSSDFPTIPKISDGVTIEIPVNVFIDGLKSVYFSAAVSDIKPEIASVFVYPKDNHLVFVSTDSYRLAEKQIAIKNCPDFPGILVPSKNIAELIKIVSDKEGMLHCSFKDTLMSIQIENLFCSFRVIDGSFPDYRQIIPKEHSTEVISLKQDLLSGLKLIGVFSDKFNQVLVTVSGKQMTFFSENNETGDTKLNIDSVVEGEDVVIKINHKYLNDGLQFIPDDSVKVLFLGDKKPIIVSGVHDKTFTYLVMPMNR